MRPDDILRLLRRQPFEPFRLCVVDGTTYDIRHPDQIVVSRSTATIAGTVANLPVSIAHRDVIVALLHISRLEPLEEAQPPPSPAPLGNGE
jgi:hypothetical protein